jgi:DNA polymerase III alpha subunit (gram-positive type)
LNEEEEGKKIIELWMKKEEERIGIKLWVDEENEKKVLENISQKNWISRRNSNIDNNNNNNNNNNNK